MLGFIWPKPFFFAWGRVNLCRLQVEHDALVREAHFSVQASQSHENWKFECHYHGNHWGVA